MAISQKLVDCSRQIKVKTNYSWQILYHAALLETDWKRMVELVQKSESEIHKRRLELAQDHNGTQEERDALVNSLNGLRVLRMDAIAWARRQSLKRPPKPDSGSQQSEARSPNAPSIVSR
jgi:hypothetical protein